MERSEGFPPIAGRDARILVLGSLPGRKSLAENEYYAHPRNAFWPIMRELLGIRGEYAARCAALRERRIAVWDVLQASVRPGSLDADIRLETARANDFAAFFDECPMLELIAFNGKKAERLFRQFVPEKLASGTRRVGLPSTSPAYAAMSFAEKLQRWRRALAILEDGKRGRQ